jgi:formylglycine-generating enzyme required for sulfatase activity
MRWLAVLLLVVPFSLGATQHTLADEAGDTRVAFDRAMAAVASAPENSDAEVKAMEQVIAAVRVLPKPPEIPQDVPARVTRAKAAADAAKTPDQFLAAAAQYDALTRSAPWTAEYQFSRGVLLQKARRYREAAQAFSLYLKAAPAAADRAKVGELIAGLERLAGKSPPQATPARPAMRRAGEEFRDCKDCPEMVVIPAGSFTMGSAPDEAGRFDSEGPQHRVRMPSFALGKYDVTVREFAAFVQATGSNPGKCEWPFGTDTSWETQAYYGQTNPVVCVNWYDARAYVDWLNHQVRGGIGGVGPYHLPSEAEWEYAARAGTTTARFWGNEIGVGHANCNGCGSKWDNNEIAAVGSFAPNPFGLNEMLGNVWQWTADCWNESYVGAPSDGSPWTSGDCSKHVLRGGSLNSLPKFLRSASRHRDDAFNRMSDYASIASFRVERSLP